MPTISRASHWRGANLIELFSTSARWMELFPIRLGHGIQESDFAMMAELGMTFARIPLSYLWFGTGPRGQSIDPDRLGLVDRAVELGREYGIHVSLNLHRAPGYCVNSLSQFDVPEPGDLFRDADRQQLFRHYWTTFARRYADVPPEELSFDLLNEPPRTDEATFDEVFGRTAEEIWRISPERLVVLEGWDAGMQPPPAKWSAHPRVVTSVHLYKPFEITHHRAPWVAATTAEPHWPLQTDVDAARRDGYVPLPGETTATWDAGAIERVLQPWIALADAGAAVHVGEMGAYATLPSAIRLAWLEAVTGVLGDHGIGWALWNLRGPFGIVDTDPAVSRSGTEPAAPEVMRALGMRSPGGRRSAEQLDVIADPGAERARWAPGDAGVLA
ncbi:Aryl-phospho-beta-D-glucosidase BglC, GH1 family [Leifsonia sp. 98AMF]|uniref:glycoside hydrolase family 5 protein n=1 Tax=unclassified Leifsonia TaxID=2663824 RepID=UPI000879D300|nr:MULTISPECIES: cellulase family glycosylhydrolase [unclassified Leifsonia]SDH07135.1 Aryl-phospho-beta-D-glucosidase BglC, GH1 family [Leifsonia sp. 197AMF]SDJ33083.1 Aryl-phospho-beta-D-glucosidase BglC, GH1 family [Leifsonia sp. 466MF]SDK46852.1 Aryl-phospho-beta-D-glucosidase BglC, GH1 family [Leifsonia sp. 157MF]SDN54077.1 Aryl-phospho-beta-D-glucosidase BglC, GH1 family [Leifsonia sp. 509MF]SEN55982.1 Aryl-phospho-beta-D-glucosidase BglC, GH1 family [Leifsonia sp. 467MF]